MQMEGGSYRDEVAALSLKMNGRSMWDEEHLPACLFGPIAPVEILTMQKKGFIQQADLFHHLPAHEQERTRHTVHLLHGRGVLKGEIVFRHRPAVREQTAQPRHSQKRHRRRRNTPPAGRLKRTVRVLQFASGDARLGVSVHEIDHHT